MGLAIVVGTLADLKLHDPEGCEFLQLDFEAINSVLEHVGLPKHEEPAECEIWDADGYGYMGLHALREVAGMLWKDLPIPRDRVLTGEDIPHSSELFDKSMPYLGTQNEGILSKSPESTPPPFIHLLTHSDAQGYYVPIDFPIPLTPDVIEDETAHIWPLGSVPRLKAELQEIAAALGVPDDLTHDNKELSDLVDGKEAAPDDALWKAQAIATYSLLILREACQMSEKTGAAISFC